MRSDRYSRMLVSAVALALAACMDDPTVPEDGSFGATMNVAQEVPAVVLASTATGSATCTANGTTFSCTITYANLTSAPTAAHIHAGNVGASGAIRVNLCGAGTAPACPGTTSGTITSGAQAPTGATYQAVMTTLLNYGNYVNVHTAGNTAGEIRGQLLFEAP